MSFFLSFLFILQTADLLNRSENSNIDHQLSLRTLDETNLIKYAQTLTDIYNIITFPLCPCSSRKDNGCVILSLNSTRLRLHACSDDGKLEENQVADFDWKTIERYYVNDQSFIFEYKRSTMKVAKAITLKTLFGPFMYDCFDCIFRELQLTNNMLKQDK